MTRRTRRRLVLFFVLLLVSGLAGPIYIWLTYPPGTPAVRHAAIDGVVGGALFWGGLLLVWPSRVFAPLRRRAFPLRLLILCSYAALVTALTGILSYYRLSGRWSGSGLTPRLFAYVIVVVLSVLVILQVVRMIGPKAIANVLLGRYHSPVMERRIFLFVDLIGSTALARQIGDLALQRLISRFVFDLTGAVLEFGGEIHAYVGDGVIITWPFRRGARDGRCLRCFFAIQEGLKEQSGAYREAFGVVPEIRAGLHGGEVVVSEIGDARTAVVYSGDTVNTAARLEDAAKRHQCDLVVSGELLGQLEVPKVFLTEVLGRETLRGHEGPTELVAVSRQAREDRA